MKISKTNLDGVLKIKLQPFRDHRGEYIEIFNKVLFKKTNKRISFIQDDVSVSKKMCYVVFMVISKTWKLVTCLMGKFMLLVVNNKKRDKQYKKWKNLHYQKKIISKFLSLQDLEMLIM